MSSNQGLDFNTALRNNLLVSSTTLTSTHTVNFTISVLVLLDISAAFSQSSTTYYKTDQKTEWGQAQ